MPRRLSVLASHGLAGLLTVLALSLVPAVARASVLLPVPYTAQDNLTFSCGSCGSASSGMALAYLGGKNTSDEIEHWLYARLPCAPGEADIIARDNAYCSSHGLASPCATRYDWGASEAWTNLKAQIDSGRPFVAHVHQYGYYHYVLVSGYADGQVYLSDSAQSKKGWRSWSLFSSQWGAMGYDGIRFLLPGKGAEDPSSSQPSNSSACSGFRRPAGQAPQSIARSTACSFGSAASSRAPLAAAHGSRPRPPANLSRSGPLLVPALAESAVRIADGGHGGHARTPDSTRSPGTTLTFPFRFSLSGIILAIADLRGIDES